MCVKNAGDANEKETVCGLVSPLPSGPSSAPTAPTAPTVPTVPTVQTPTKAPTSNTIGSSGGPSTPGFSPSKSSTNLTPTQTSSGARILSIELFGLWIGYSGISIAGLFIMVFG
ncbi:13287_t:CDS:2 [Ambispora gerdemannii]|uniref:13287_t:CDS:1 n=1 Tax=Ambispora gerdemannii TaxID=144530 RepID=A0A9N9GDU0_9GLOM|nr:13287_t:CDS:2 [Ambispora gerdemannii]